MLLNEWEKTARYMLRRKYARERRAIPVELFSPSRHWDSIQQAVLPEDWAWLWDEGVDLGLFRYGHCVTGSIEGVEALGGIGELHILTQRPHRAVQGTSDWVAFMFNRATIASVTFRDEKAGFDADIFIDDGVHQILSLHSAGKPVIIYNQPWNQEMPHNVGTRVYNWSGVVDAVQGALP